MVDFKKEEFKDEFIVFKDDTIASLENYINNSLDENQKRCASIVYWLNDYINYLSFENKFSANYLPVYKYGAVIDVNLGFNVGDEFGGKHYCVVLNKHDNKRNKLLTIVPLSSLKSNKTIKDLNRSEIYLGTTLHDLLDLKFKTEINLYNEMLKDLKEKGNQIRKELNSTSKNKDTEIKSESFEAYLKKVKKTTKKLNSGIKKSKNRLNKIGHLKEGSYARCSQITTISKMRIFDPKNNNDALIDIQLPQENIKDISKTIQKLFLEKI